MSPTDAQLTEPPGRPLMEGSCLTSVLQEPPEKNKNKNKTTDSLEDPCLDTIIGSQLKSQPLRRKFNIGEHGLWSRVVLGLSHGSAMYEAHM